MKLALALLFAWAVGFADAHVLEIEGILPAAEEGFVIGNGDLSASIWPQGDAIVVRLGKGDVWDRRIEMPSHKPITQREYLDGLLKEGWKRLGWKDGREQPYQVTGEKVLTDERRAQVAVGTSHTMGAHAYPCPKPTGDLRIQVPRDFPGPKWLTRLFVEEGRATVTISWSNGVRLETEVVVAADDNIVSARWQIFGLTDDNRLGDGKRPLVCYGLSRHRDSESYYRWLEQRACDEQASIGMYTGRQNDTAPLPPPTAEGNRIEQRFPPDPTFPEGFFCRLWLHADWATHGRWVMKDPRGARVCVNPRNDATEGEVAVVVRTSSDGEAGPPAMKRHADYAASAKRAAAGYWRVSGVRVPDDPALENAWYATYHARRSVLKPGTVPPGLFLPSTVQDYSWWHGDYHSNYNIQSVYWGDLAANRLDDARTYFTLMKNWLTPIAKKIARDYYGCRGAFYQLEGVPVKLADDLNGVATFGRMAYMTGWMMNKYWEFYEYTRDRAWLRDEGYEVIRDCALFYLDFLKKAPSDDLPPQLADGKYHVFPSNDWEKHPTGDAMKFCDQPENVNQARFSLWAAIRASEVLETDVELRQAWRDRLENLVGEGPELKGYEKLCFYANPPEMFGPGKPFVEQADLPPCARRSGPETFYYGHDLSGYVFRMRTNAFNSGRDWNRWRTSLANWLHGNGLAWAMPISDYGRAGAWTETLSAMAPMNEMLLQSWEGAIRLFPYWPKAKDVSFFGFRAQGAFLVDASLRDGRICDVKLTSEKGEDCLVHGDWKVLDAAKREVATDRDEYGRLRFKTVAGATYCLVP